MASKGLSENFGKSPKIVVFLSFPSGNVDLCLPAEAAFSLLAGDVGRAMGLGKVDEADLASSSDRVPCHLAWRELPSLSAAVLVILDPAWNWLSPQKTNQLQSNFILSGNLTEIKFRLNQHDSQGFALHSCAPDPGGVSPLSPQMDVAPAVPSCHSHWSGCSTLSPVSRLHLQLRLPSR